MSTIFADNLKNTSGGNNVKVNQLSGIDTAGSISIQGEGTATTNMQQGLAKHWLIFNQSSGVVIGDSFNTTSATDEATGRANVTLTTSLSSGNYSATAGGCADLNASNNQQARQGPAQNSLSSNFFQVNCGSNTYAQDDWDIVTTKIHGDLA